jgi:hypothetical protein
MVVTLSKSSSTGKKAMDHPSLLVQLFDMEARGQAKVSISNCVYRSRLHAMTRIGGSRRFPTTTHLWNDIP